MIEQISTTLRVIRSSPPARPGDLAQLRERFPELPDDYCELVSQATDVELEDRVGGYLHLWGPARCLEVDEWQQLSKWLGGAIPIGDDGRGRFLQYAQGDSGWALFLQEPDRGDGAYRLRVANGLEKLLCTEGLLPEYPGEPPFPALGREWVLRGGAIWLIILALGAFEGAYRAAHATSWHGVANGRFAFECFGLAIPCGALLLLLYALVTSPWMQRVEWLLPLRGRWARYLVNAVIVVLWLLLLLLVFGRPVA
jgi:hypothetical protein